MRRYKKRLFSRHLVRLTILLLVAIFFSWLASLGWLFELFSHFPVYYIFAGGILCISLLLSKRYRWALLAIFLCLTQVYKLLPFWQMPSVVEPFGAPTEAVTLLQYNVNRNNDRVNDMARWVISNTEKIDIVVLMEVSDRWQIALERVKWSYPYHITKEVRGHHPIVVLSRLLIDDLEVQELANGEYAIVIRGATLNKETPFVLYAVHPTPPILPVRKERRDEVMLEAAKRIGLEAIPHKILVGDFNMTPFSPVFKDVQDLSGLYNSDEGLGHYMGTWPAMFPKSMAIPIDGLLVSPFIKVESKQLGPAMGSDHYPVISNLSFIQPVASVSSEQPEKEPEKDPHLEPEPVIIQELESDQGLEQGE